MKIAIASGKGGTGKTTVSFSLYYFLSQVYKHKVQLIDCDVEEPNVLLFMQDAAIASQEEVFSIVPKINTEHCTFCKKCAEWCAFNAITIVKNLQFAEVNTDLCHSCGVCTVACTNNAISQYQKPLGILTNYYTKWGLGIREGRLEIGSAMQTSLIKKVKEQVDKNAIITLYDAPPGTSCPVVETVADADYVILVSEPTPFGLNDLKITVNLLNELNRPFGVICNKADLGNKAIYDFLSDENIELLGRIPFSKDYAKNYSTGELLENMPKSIATAYRDIVIKLQSKIKV